MPGSPATTPRGPTAWPTAAKQGGYKSVHVLTAACPETGRAEGLVHDRLNTDVV